MTSERISGFLRKAVAAAVVIGVLAGASPAGAQDTPVPRQTCTATNVGGSAYDGLVCGGSVIDDCTPGAIYDCQGGGVQDPVNNCVLAQTCATGCLTGLNSTPPTANTDFPVASDECFAGARPLTVSPANPVGGGEVVVTATLSESQNTANGPILNMYGGGTVIPHPFCAVPFRLAPGATTSPASVSFGLPTAVVASPAEVNLHAGISYTDTSGRGRFLVSIPFTVHVQAGGTEPPPPAVKTVTVGPSVIGAGDMAVGDVVLEKFAPARGIRATLTSSHPSVAAIVENNQPFVQGACTMSPGMANIQAAPFVEHDTTVTISATSGAPNETPATTTLTVSATPLDLARVSLNPSSVLAGGSSTGTLTMTRPAPAGGAEVLITSSEAAAIVPASVVVPAGATSATFTIATRADAAAFASATIGGSYDGGFDASAQLHVWPAGTAQAVEALSLDPSSVVGPASSTGIVTLRYAPPSDAAAVALSSSNTTVARVPASVAVPVGATKATFSISTSEVAGATASTIAAALGNSSRTATLTVQPANPPPASAVLSTFTLNPTTVEGGQSATGTVTLASAAPAGGVPVNLGSQIPTVASVPASVMVAAGATTATFTIATFQPSGTTVVQLTASLNGTTKFATITVTQGAVGGGASGFLSPAGNAPENGGDGNGFESSPTNAYGDDAAVAADMNSGSGTNTGCTSSGKDRHRFYDFGIAVPSGSAIAGIEVRVDARADSTSGSPRMCVQLSGDGGSTWTSAKATATLGTTIATYTLGGAADAWGRSWTPANFGSASFRVRVVNVSSSTSRDFFLDWIAVKVHTGSATPPPAPALQTIAVSPSTVTGGNSSTATVTLTAPAPPDGAIVSLSSSSSAAAVPASVAVAAGATSATFTVATQSVTTNASASVSASYGGVTKATTLSINAPAAGDTVSIQRAEYDGQKRELRVEATSTSSSATLRVHVAATNELIGTLANNGGGRYGATLSWPVNPQNITVRSSLGGSASINVVLK